MSSELFEAVINQHPEQPKQQLLAIFVWIDELLSSADSCGCPFLMVASEFPEPNYPGHQVTIAHKQKMRERMIELAELAGINQAQELSAALLMLVDGAFAERRLFKQPSTEVSLAKAAAIMIEAYGIGFNNVQSEIVQITAAAPIAIRMNQGELSL